MLIVLPILAFLGSLVLGLALLIGGTAFLSKARGQLHLRRAGWVLVTLALLAQAWWIGLMIWGFLARYFER